LDARGADGRETPAASFTLVRVMENEVEIASLGDCLTLVEGHDGVVQVSDHPVLEEIEAAIKRDMRALRAAGVAALADVRKRMLPSLHAQRRKRNIPGGYGVLSPDQACLPLLKVRRLPATAIRRLLLVSDGYYRLVDHYGAMSDAELLAQTAALGPDELLRRLRAIEAADPEAVRFPRFKLSDDATALLLRLP
jgi:serine/threonine protein phosphatase PrpC